jgi:hypothetical protein
VVKIKSFATKEGEMKFLIAEQNIGDDATKEQAEKLIELLKEKGWDVEYGAGRNVATDVSEFGQEEKIQEAFADDFMLCISLLENDML